MLPAPACTVAGVMYVKKISTEFEPGWRFYGRVALTAGKVLRGSARRYCWIVLTVASGIIVPSGFSTRTLKAQSPTF